MFDFQNDAKNTSKTDFTGVKLSFQDSNESFSAYLSIIRLLDCSTRSNLESNSKVSNQFFLSLEHWYKFLKHL